LALSTYRPFSPPDKKQRKLDKLRLAEVVVFEDFVSVKESAAEATRRGGRAETSIGQVKTPSRIAIRNMLVPIDFSAASLEAVEFALPLSKRFKAELHLVHVFEPDYPLASIATARLIIPDLEVGRRLRRHLKAVASDYGMNLGPGNIHLLKGSPYEQICGLARDQKMDLIVIATRGNTGLKHVLLGSTAERVVRYSPCPVLVVREISGRKRTARGKGSAAAAGFRKILVPIDFSESSMKGLAYAKAFAREFKAKLFLLHAVHLQYYVASDEYARYDLPKLMEQTEKAAREQMRDLVRSTDWNGLQVEPLIEVGHPGDQICARAKDRGVDLIITATHGRTGFKHALIGSTAEYVARQAECPVLVVPARTNNAAGKKANPK
jgi:nucleotide-binding universal stress UspA family protein